jgi:hypothetical protein
MSVDPRKALLEGLSHAARHEHKKGNHSGGVGLTLIVFGIFTLPIPIIGIPLIVLGIIKCFS